MKIAELDQDYVYYLEQVARGEIDPAASTARKEIKVKNIFNYA